MRAGSTLSNVNGNAVDVVIDRTDGEDSSKDIVIYNTKAENLTFKSFKDTGAAYKTSLYIKENAGLTVLEDVDLYKDEGDSYGSNLYVEEDAELIIQGDLAVSNISERLGSITVDNLLVNTSYVTENGSLTVNNWMTVTTNFTSNSAETFNVKNLRTDNSYSGTVYVPLYNGLYQFDNLILGGGVDDSDKEGAYSGIQLFNSNLTVENVLVESGTNGMIDFQENKNDGSALTANINNLYVEDTGTLLLNAQEVGQNNILTVDAATFGSNSVIKGQDGNYDINLQINQLSADSLTFEKLSEHSNVSLGRAALSGANSFAQKIMGIKTVIVLILY